MYVFNYCFPIKILPFALLVTIGLLNAGVGRTFPIKSKGNILFIIGRASKIWLMHDAHKFFCFVS